jgi:hypothetical protein
MSVVASNWVACISLAVLIWVRKCVLQRAFARAGDFAYSYSPVVSTDDKGMMAEVDGDGFDDGLGLGLDPSATARPQEDANSTDVSADVRGTEEDPEDNWPPLSRDVFRDWGSFLSLGIPGAISLFFEWGTFEAVAGIAGQLGPVGLATHGVFMSTASLFYQFPSAIATATTTLAGHYLGGNDAHNAKFMIQLGLWVDFAWGIGAGSVLVFALRPYWGSVYTDVEEVSAMVAATLPILLLYITVDSTKCITLNILRSTGRPGITAKLNIVACVFVMLPLGYLLALKLDYGLIGIWLALSAGWIFATSVYLYVIVHTDWQAQADCARDRNISAAAVAMTTVSDQEQESSEQDKVLELRELHMHSFMAEKKNSEII